MEAPKNLPDRLALVAYETNGISGDILYSLVDCRSGHAQMNQSLVRYIRADLATITLSTGDTFTAAEIEDRLADLEWDRARHGELASWRGKRVKKLGEALTRAIDGFGEAAIQAGYALDRADALDEENDRLRAEKAELVEMLNAKHKGDQG